MNIHQRLLIVSDIIENIHISNVYGTYYQYCIGFTKYYPGKTTGVFKNISIDHVYASKASRDGIYPWTDSYVFPFIYFQDDTHSKNVKITDVYRMEKQILDTIVNENHTNGKMPMLVNHGSASEIVMKNVRQKKKRK